MAKPKRSGGEAQSGLAGGPWEWELGFGGSAHGPRQQTTGGPGAERGSEGHAVGTGGTGERRHVWAAEDRCPGKGGGAEPALEDGEGSVGPSLSWGSPLKFPG